MSSCTTTRQPRARLGRYQACASCDVRIASETLKIPEFSSSFLTEDESGLILCNDCLQGNLFAAVQVEKPKLPKEPRPKNAAAVIVAKAKAAPMALPAAETSLSSASFAAHLNPLVTSSVSSAAAQQRVAKRAPWGSLRPRIQPKRPMYSHDNILEFCISRFYEGADADAEAAGPGVAVRLSPAAASGPAPLDVLWWSFSSLHFTRQHAAQGRAKRPRKSSAPTKRDGRSKLVAR